MAKIRIWKGFHSPELRDFIKDAWAGKELLILLPPVLTDFSFVRFLPEGQVEMSGSWDAVSSERLHSAAREPRAQVSYPDEPILGVFTTGTISGSPRLVLYSRKNVESSLRGVLTFFEASRIRGVFCYPQAFHTFGLTLGYILAFLLDVRLVTASGKYTRASHEVWLENSGEGMLTLGTPTHFRDLITVISQRGVRPKATYSAIAGGARVTVGLWKDMREKLGIEAPTIGYGATEAAPGVTHLPAGRMPLEDGEIGFPLPQLTRAEIIPNTGVRFEGPSVCMAMVQNGKIEFPTTMVLRDDVIRRESDGVWIYRGRTDLVLNRGGLKVSLEQLEETLQKQLGIEAVCVPISDERLGEELGILVRGERGRKTERKRIYEVLRQQLGVEPNPGYFAEVEEFPVNGSLKLNRQASAALLSQQIKSGMR